jgi:hypothetical protein
VDTFRNTLDSMDARFGEQLYVGWIHPYSSGNSAGGACVPIDIRQANGDLADVTGRRSLGFLPIKGSIKVTGAA